MKKPAVIGIGSAFVDYFLEGNTAFFKKHHLQEEFDDIVDQKKLFDDAVRSLPHLGKSSGGASVNTIVALAKLGIHSAYYGLIGTDKESDFFLNQLAAVDIKRVMRKGVMSQCACILTNKRTKRTFASVENPYDNEFFQHIDFTYVKDAEFLHIAPFYLDIAKTFEKLCTVVEKMKGPKISVTTAVAYAELGIPRLTPLLKNTFIIFINEMEIKMLLKKDKEEGSKKLLAYGPKIVVCTLGEKGVLITTKEKQFYASGKKVTNIVDTTGAGDAFAAGFLYGIIKNKSLEWSADFANTLAAQAITDFGLHWLRSFEREKLLNN